MVRKQRHTFHHQNEPQHNRLTGNPYEKDNHENHNQSRYDVN